MLSRSQNLIRNTVLHACLVGLVVLISRLLLKLMFKPRIIVLRETFESCFELLLQNFVFLRALFGGKQLGSAADLPGLLVRGNDEFRVISFF